MSDNSFIRSSVKVDANTQDAMAKAHAERVRVLRRIRRELMNDPRPGMMLRRLPESANLPEELMLWPTWPTDR